jgi:hypothetical protein
MNTSHIIQYFECLFILWNKKPELDILLDSTKPDVIIGTETWLDPTISS